MSASESAFSDAEDDPAVSAGAGERKRLRSVDDIVQDIEGKKQRVVSPRPVKQVKSKAKQQTGMTQEFLHEIKTMIDSSIKGAVDSLWEKIDRKFDQKIASLESKVEKLEGQVFEKDHLIDELRSKAQRSELRLSGLEEQVEDMERNSRSSNLIFWSEQLGKRVEEENIAAKTIKLINESFPTITVSRQDFTAIHRLPGDNSVICSFASKNLRNEVFSERFCLNRKEVAARGKVFVNESLTKAKREIFSKLLDLKRQGRIWTAFTKNGVPCLKMLKESSPERIHSMQQLDDVLRRAPPLAPPPPGPDGGSAWPPGGPWRGGGGRAPPAARRGWRAGGPPASGGTSRGGMARSVSSAADGRASPSSSPASEGSLLEAAPPGAPSSAPAGPGRAPTVVVSAPDGDSVFASADSRSAHAGSVAAPDSALAPVVPAPAPAAAELEPACSAAPAAAAAASAGAVAGSVAAVPVYSAGLVESAS